MRSHIRKCPECGKYSLSSVCRKCGVTTQNTFPPRYSPEDRWGMYRRMTLYGKDTEEGKE